MTLDSLLEFAFLFHFSFDSSLAKKIVYFEKSSKVKIGTDKTWTLINSSNNKASSEILNIVDDDEVVLGARVHKIRQLDLALEVHAHVPERVLGEHGPQHGFGQLPFFNQHKYVLHNIFKLLKRQFFVPIFIDEFVDLRELVLHSHV